MTWTHTSRGRALDLLDPRLEDVDLDEIATALGNQCRYNGCVRAYYSVAEHSVLIAEWLEDQEQYRRVVLGGLLHDAAEAYTGDITWPVQAVLFDLPDGEGETQFEAVGRERVRFRYKAMQRRLDALIVDKVNAAAGREVVTVADLHCEAVRSADLRILLDERKALLTEPPPRPWAIEEAGGRPLGVEIQGWDPAYAGKMWAKTLGGLIR